MSKIKEQIIEWLQSQFDTDGMTETATGSPVIFLNDAICAVEEAFDQATKEGKP